MSSGFQVQRICQHCDNVFIAKTSVTKYCSHTCNSRAYKANTRKQKIKSSLNEIDAVKKKQSNTLKDKDFLTVKDAAVLLNCSIRTIYRLIEKKELKAVNLLERKTTIKRTELDKLFN